MVSWKYLSNFRRTFEMSLINCEISLQLKCCRSCIIVAGTKNNKKWIFHAKLYFPAVTLSTQENIKLLKQLESSFKRTIYWNKYLAKTKNQVQYRYLDYLIDLSFKGVSWLFVLPFKDDDNRESHKEYYLPTVEIKYYNIMIDGGNFFDQPIKSGSKIYDNIGKIETGQGDNYTIGCLLDYPYFKKYYKLNALHLNKQQKLDPDPKARKEQLKYYDFILFRYNINIKNDSI